MTVDVRQGPIRVLLVSPYGLRGGGMGRCMEYLAAVAPHDFEYTMCDSRGSGPALTSGLFMCLSAIRIVLAARRSAITIVHLNIAEGGSVLRKGMLARLAHALSMPCVVHLHAAEIVSFYARLPLVLRRWVARSFCRADAVVALGLAHETWLRDLVGVDPRRIVIVRNGVAPPADAGYRAHHTGFHFVFLGNLQPRKGVSDLLHALAAPCLSPFAWSLTLAGGGDTRGMRIVADGLGIGHRTELTGWLDRDRATSILAGASALALPSYHEALPLVVLEALSCGVPVMATAVGCLPEVLVDGETALLVAPGDRAALTRAAHRLLTDPALCARIGQAGRSLYEREFTQQAFADRMCAVYRSVTCP